MVVKTQDKPVEAVVGKVALKGGFNSRVAKPMSKKAEPEKPLWLSNLLRQSEARRQRAIRRRRLLPVDEIFTRPTLLGPNDETEVSLA